MDAGVDNSVVLAVGRRSSGSRGSIYSTMAGGECDGWTDPCSWRQLGVGRTARTECLRALLAGADEPNHALGSAEAAEAATRLVDAAFAGCAVSE